MKTKINKNYIIAAKEALTYLESEGWAVDDTEDCLHTPEEEIAIAFCSGYPQVLAHAVSYLIKNHWTIECNSDIQTLDNARKVYRKKLTSLENKSLK